jgi:hypothetical protein
MEMDWRWVSTGVLKGKLMETRTQKPVEGQSKAT